MLSGDLYHYPEEMTYKRIPSFDFAMEQTAKSRAMIEEFVKKNNAQLWIQHDYTAGIKLRLRRSFTSRSRTSLARKVPHVCVSRAGDPHGSSKTHTDPPRLGGF